LILRYTFAPLNYYNSIYNIRLYILTSISPYIVGNIYYKYN